MPAKHELMRSTNTLLVLDHIRKFGASTRRVIQGATGLSWAAVSNITADLISKDILTENLSTMRLAGRNPGYLDFVPMRNLSVGVEMNAGGLTVLLLDLRGKVIDACVEPFSSMERDSVIEQMLGGVRRLLDMNELDEHSLLGIGIAMQGSVDREGTTSLHNAFFKNWRNVPLKQICEEWFHVPVRVIHDPICIALEEQWNRKYTAEDDFALIRLSYGIGMGYISQGMPISGYDGVAGELGHIVLDRNGLTCSCGNQGCMESYCSIRGMTGRILDAHRAGKLTLPETLAQTGESSVSSMREILAWGATRAMENDPELLRIFDDAAYYLGIGIANIVSLLNPKYIILTGELMDFRDLFYEKAQRIASDTAWSLSKFQILISGGGRQLAAIGAAMYFINSAFSTESRLLT